jgi:hypothetical protein
MVFGVAPQLPLLAYQYWHDWQFTTVAVAGIVLESAAVVPDSHNSYVMVYVPLGVLAARVTIPSASILNGPVVNGVTFVLISQY